MRPALPSANRPSPCFGADTALTRRCRCAVTDEPCSWFPANPPDPRYPEDGSGPTSENYQDSLLGDDYSKLCRTLITQGEAGRFYTCERDFCPTCGTFAGYCDAYCGYCRPMAGVGPHPGDYPTTQCVPMLVDAVERYRAHCTSCVEDPVSHEVSCSPRCGVQTYTPPCTIEEGGRCVEDSGFSNFDCAALLDRGVACDRDLGDLGGAAGALLAGQTLNDKCQVSCGTCTCEEESGIDDPLGLSQFRC